MRIYFVYVTACGAEEAATLATAAVSERLAACANALSEVRSTYWWEGEVQRDHECALILKTAEDRLEQLRQRVTELHSYELPCVVAMEIADASEEYRDWVVAETRKPVVYPASD